MKTASPVTTGICESQPCVSACHTIGAIQSGDQTLNLSSKTSNFHLYSVPMPGRCRKLVAAFVLIWALADLTVPGLCQADDNRIVPGDSVLFLGSQPKQGLTFWSAQGGLSPDHEGSPDECFCCSPYASPTSVHSAHTCLDVSWTLDGSVARIPIVRCIGCKHDGAAIATSPRFIS